MNRILSILCAAFALWGMSAIHAQTNKGSWLGTAEDYQRASDAMRKAIEEDERACPSADSMEWVQEREGGSVCRPMSENKRALRKYCTAPQSNEELTACVDAIDRMPCASPYEKEYSKKNAFEFARKYSALRAAEKGGNERAAEFIRNLPSGMPTLECRNTSVPTRIDSSSSDRALKLVADEWDKIRIQRCRTKQQEELKRERSDPSSRPTNAIDQAKRRMQCLKTQAVDFAGKPILSPVPQSVDGVYNVSAKTGIIQIYDIALCTVVRTKLAVASFACYRQ